MGDGKPDVLSTFNVATVASSKSMRATSQAMAVRRTLKSGLATERELVVAEYGDDRIRLVDLEKGKRSREISAFPRVGLRDIAVDSAGQYVAALSGAQGLKLYSVKESERDLQLVEIAAPKFQDAQGSRDVLFSEPGNLHVFENRRKEVAAFSWELPSLTQRTSRYRKSGVHEQLESVLVSHQSGLYLLFSQTNERLQPIGWRVAPAVAPGRTVYTTGLHATAEVDSADGTSAFAEYRRDGTIKVVPLGARMKGRGAGFLFRPQRFRSLLFTLGVSSPKGGIFAIGTERIVGRGRADVLLHIARRDQGYAESLRTFRFANDVFSVTPIGFLEEGSQLVVETLRKEPQEGSEHKVKVQLQIIGVSGRE